MILLFPSLKCVCYGVTYIIKKLENLFTLKMLILLVMSDCSQTFQEGLSVSFGVLLPSEKNYSITENKSPLDDTLLLIKIEDRPKQLLWDNAPIS